MPKIKPSTKMPTTKTPKVPSPKVPKPKYAVGDLVLRSGSNATRVVTATRKPDGVHTYYLLDDTTPWIPESEVSRCQYEADHRCSNPGLHMLYVKSAVKHLAILDRMIAELYGQSNLNLTDAICGLQEAREKLLRTNPAYIDAQEVIDNYMEGTHAQA